MYGVCLCLTAKSTLMHHKIDSTLTLIDKKPVSYQLTKCFCQCTLIGGWGYEVRLIVPTISHHFILQINIFPPFPVWHVQCINKKESLSQVFKFCHFLKLSTSGSSGRCTLATFVKGSLNNSVVIYLSRRLCYKNKHLHTSNEYEICEEKAICSHHSHLIKKWQGQ